MNQPLVSRLNILKIKMQFLHLTASAMLIATSLKAECYYTDFDLTFEIEHAGTKAIYYAQLSACDFTLDSAQNQDYLLAALTAEGDPELISIFTDRLRYSYCYETKADCNNNQKDEVFQLLHKTLLKKTSINSIRLLDAKRGSAMLHIANDLSIADSTWLQQKPIKAMGFGFDLCDSQLFIHSLSDEINAVISTIEAFRQRVASLEDTVLSRQQEDGLYDEYERINALISRQSHVVLLTECTD